MFLKPLSPDKDKYLFIDFDDDIDSVRTKISESDAGASTIAFNILNSCFGYEKNVRAGRYDLDGVSTFQLFRNLRNHHSAEVKMVVPSVRTVKELAGRISKELMLDSATVAETFNKPEVWDSLGYTKETFPALFVPNTYDVYWEISMDDLIARLEKENKNFWEGERNNKAQEIGLSHNEVMTLASIVDSETSNNAEKARIAGLYMNRLNSGMALQSDPTVIFAIGDYSIHRVTGKYLQYPSPYNTYKNKGLPPGPICIPSIAGIDAVLNYEHHKYMYMCAKEDFSGSHNFAVTYSEHQVNARKYTEALNKKGIE